MHKIQMLKQTMLGCLLLFGNSLMGKFSFPTLSKIVAAPKQLFAFNHKTAPTSRTIQIFNDLEDDLEYILNVDSLKDLTDQLTVYANGVQLVQDQLNTVPLPNNTCTFSVQFPIKALLKALEKEKMQLLLKTYEGAFNEFLKNNANTFIRQFCNHHYNEWWFKLLLKIPKLEINFTYKITEDDQAKECLRLLPILLRKKEELEEATQKGLTKAFLHYAPLKTIVITIPS